MPTYYLHLRDGVSLHDTEGTDLADLASARAHLIAVAQELMHRADSFLDLPWSDWTMLVQDEAGTELLSVWMGSFIDGEPGG